MKWYFKTLFAMTMLLILASANYYAGAKGGMTWQFLPLTWGIPIYFYILLKDRDKRVPP